MAGFIYIMSNPTFGKLIKIGKSDFDPIKRRDELSNTSVPDDFKIEYYAFLENHHQIEPMVHESLKHFRHKNNREFFSCEIHTAAQLIKDIAKSDFKYEEINYSIENEQINNKFPIKKYVLNFLDENWKIVIVVSFLCIYMLFNV